MRLLKVIAPVAAIALFVLGLIWAVKQSWGI